MNAEHSLKVKGSGGFTLVELLTVITIIVVLAGLTAGTMGFVSRKAASNKAEAQMHLLQNALEQYHSDTGVYPEWKDEIERDADGLILYYVLFGDGVGADGIRDTADDGAIDGIPDEGAKVFLSQMDPNMNSMQLLQGPKGKVPTKIVDPFGNVWHYISGAEYQSTMMNPDFDLFSYGADGKKDTDDDINNW